MTWNKPVPLVDADIKPFYEGLKKHQFLLLRCKTCGAWYFPAAYCRNHENAPFLSDMEWTPASGRGTVATFNIHRTAFNPAFRDDIPYVFALAQLTEGPMFGTTILGCRPEDVFVGMDVEIAFEDHPDDLGMTLPRFRESAKQSGKET